MKRIVLAFLSAPMLISIGFGWPGMVLVAPFAVSIALVIGAPLFIIFRKFGWLNWWHAAFGGLVCGLAFVVIFDSAGRLDMFGIEDSLLFGGTGIAIAIIFWWLGLFRNSTVPSVSRSIPYSMLILIPLVAIGVLIHRSLDIFFVEGRIIAVQGDAPSRELTVRMSNGVVVQSWFLRDSRPTETLLNQCWHFTNHWSTWRFKRVYSPTSPFGGDVNDC